MSSLVNAILYSDPATPRAIPQRTGNMARSSSRAPGPTSDDDDGGMDVDPDDEVVGSRGLGRAGRPRTDLSAVPKVSDEAGDQIMNAFIGFLEKWAPPVYVEVMIVLTKKQLRGRPR